MRTALIHEIAFDPDVVHQIATDWGIGSAAARRAAARIAALSVGTASVPAVVIGAMLAVAGRQDHLVAVGVYIPRRRRSCGAVVRRHVKRLPGSLAAGRAA